MNDIRRRLKQQQNNQVNIISRKPNELTKCSCYNNSDHTWEKTFDNILEMENSRIVQQPLSYENLKDIANIMSENIVTLAEELDFFMSNDAIHQILRVMPVMLLKREKCIFLNLHEFIYTPGVIEALLLSADPNIDSEEHEPETVNDINENLISTETPEKNLNENRGQPSITIKFPSVVNIAADFVKQHSFAAQIRRRTNTRSSAGVSIVQIRTHILENVPGLREHRISIQQ